MPSGFYNSYFLLFYNVLCTYFTLWHMDFRFSAWKYILFFHTDSCIINLQYIILLPAGRMYICQNVNRELYMVDHYCLFVYEITSDSRMSSRNKYRYYYLYYKHRTDILDKVYNLRFHIEFCDAIFAMVIKKKLSSDQSAIHNERYVLAGNFGR